MFARTERLLLRPSWPEDAHAIHAAVADERIVRNLALVPWPYTHEDATAFATRDQDFDYPNFMLMLRTNDAPRLIGSCGLVRREGAVELGYWISRPFWGQGFATEAGRAVIDIARVLGHQRLVSGHFNDNPASGRVLRKLGFRPTGQTEQHFSAGRGRKANCALFERLLTADADIQPAALRDIAIPTRTTMAGPMMPRAA